MSQTALSHEPIEEASQDQPQADPWLVDVIRAGQLFEAREEREEVKPPPREESKSVREETRSTPTPRPARPAFNRD